jgi:pilus assembly protein CpaC
MSAHLQRALLCATAALALSATPALAGANANELGAARCETGNINAHRVCTLPLNKSLIIDLPADARDVLVSNPGIADVVVRTSRRIYLTGVAVGQTNLFVFDGDGNTIVSLDLQVERDISGLEETLRRLIPNSNIVVEMINDNIVLWGSVQNAADSQRATEVANIFANAGANAQPTTPAADPGAGGVTVQVTGGQGTPATSSIVNLLTIEGEDQVFLTVTVAEMERNTIKQLGIDWNLENFQVGGNMVFSAATSAVFPANILPPTRNLTAEFVQNITIPDPGGTAGDLINARNAIGATIQALEQTGLMRTLAEPTLTAISGESASFLAGGEFPVPVRADGQGNVVVEYKPFGVSLAFSPVVLSEGRISLHVEVEVSEITGNGALQIGGVTLPGLNVRRAETTLEMPSGGALVMSGLIQDQINEVISGLPGIRQVPILGTLFGSRDFLRSETELVIIVTPYLVQPVARGQLAQPDQGFQPAGDVQANFFGQLNLRYGAQGQGGTQQAGYYGNPGFIFQ